MEKYSDLMHYTQSFYLNWHGSTSALEPIVVKLMFLLLMTALFKEELFY